MLELNQLYCMDCLEGMKQLEENSIDLIVTDPPYQLDSIRKRFGKAGSAPAQYRTDGAFQRASRGFMGKEWDVLPKQEIWNEMFRVLKAGAFAFIMMTPRQDSSWRTCAMLETAGFQISFTPLYWAYASGFPKASNISKMVDKKMGVEMPIGKRFTTAGKGNEKMEDPTPIGEERDKMRHKATSLQAKALDGSYGGFQPKPAVELILVAMKPCTEKTYVNQALKNKKGITWLDDCRIPYGSDKDFEDRKRGKVIDGEELNSDTEYNKNFGLKTYDSDKYLNQQGRFPANLLVSDDVLNDGDVSKGQQGAVKGTEPSKDKLNLIYGDYRGYLKPSEPRGDSGSFSRYFDLDKWFINKLPESVKKTFPFLIVPKASKGERDGMHGVWRFLKILRTY